MAVAPIPKDDGVDQATLAWSSPPTDQNQSNGSGKNRRGGDDDATLVPVPRRGMLQHVVAFFRLLLCVFVNLALAIHVCGFLFFRIADLMVLFQSYPIQCLCSILAGFVVACSILHRCYYAESWESSASLSWSSWSSSSSSSSLHPSHRHHNAAAAAVASAREGRGSMYAAARRVGIVFVTTAALCYLFDVHLPLRAPPPAVVRPGDDDNDIVVKGRMGAEPPLTVVITGGNSGVGYEAARVLVLRYGATVVLGCRNQRRCEAAASTINSELRRSGGGTHEGRAIPLTVDLSSFSSVSAFAGSIRSLRLSPNVLFNNAGYVPVPGTAVNDQTGLDPSFQSMHLSHHLLTELLLKDHPSTLTRVVNTSSGTHHFCAIYFAYLPPRVLRMLRLAHSPGCIDESYLPGLGDSDGGGGRKLGTKRGGVRSPTDGASYIRSKVANMMHAWEVPRRHPNVEGVAIDLGWVGTSIIPIMTWNGGMGKWIDPYILGWMRHASTEAGIGPAINAIIRPLEGEGKWSRTSGGDARGDDVEGVAVNLFGHFERPFTSPWWTSDGRSGMDVGRERMKYLASRLWNISNEILKENGYDDRSAD